jgi:hypothetical protein
LKSGNAGVSLWPCLLPGRVPFRKMGGSMKKMFLTIVAVLFLLADKVNGEPVRYADAVVMAKSGKMNLSDASTRFAPRIGVGCYFNLTGYLLCDWILTTGYIISIYL